MSRTRKVWTRQPQHAAPLAGGLASKLFFLTTPTHGTVDVVSKAPLVLTSVSPKAGQGGVGWEHGSGSSLRLAHATRLNFTNNFTLFGLVRSTSASGSQYILNKNYDGSSVPYSLSIGGAANTAGIAQYNGGWQQSTLGGKDIRGDGLVHLVVGTCTGGLLSYYVDGVLYGQGGSGTLVSGTGDLYIGRYQNDAASFIGDIYIAGGLSVALSAAQVRAFNPWNLLAKRRKQRSAAVVAAPQSPPPPACQPPSRPRRPRLHR